MSEAGLFQKCPSVGAHSGVTLQQTYYLLFCHFGFSTANLGQDSISAPEMSDSLTASHARPGSPYTHSQFLIASPPSGCVLSRWVGVGMGGGGWMPAFSECIFS